MLRIAIVGCGNMGTTYARSFLQFNLVTRENLLLVARNEEHAARLEEKNLGTVTAGLNGHLDEAGIVVVAVKPQDFAGLAPELGRRLKSHQLVLSAMAGITLESLAEALEHRLIVRAMPNTPTQMGMGVTAFLAHEEVNIHQISIIDNLLNTTGRTILLEDEKLLDAVTALSGSGPAYFFYMVKAMIEAGVAMGLDEPVAAMLVKQTMQGSYHLMNQSPRTLDELIDAVSSKGGTTEAAFRTFAEHGLADGLQAGIRSAERRAGELSRRA